MDHISRNLVRAELLGYVAHLVFRVVSDAAHPEPKGPERRYRTAARQRRVLGKNVFWLAEKDEQIEVLVARIDHVVRVVAFAEVESQRRARMHKHSVTVAAEKERYRLVHVLVLRAHAVARGDEHALSAFVETSKRFTAAEDLLVVLQLESRGDAA